MMTDPIADMLTRIRNANQMRKETVVIPSSKVKSAILEVLKNEGYIADYAVSADINSYACGDIFYISTTCLKKNLEKVLFGLCEEIVSLKEKGITAEDLAYAKLALKTDLISDWSDPQSFIFDCAEDYLLNRFVPFDEKLRLYEQVTIEDIHNSIKNIFSVAPTYGVIGNAPNIPSYQQILKRLHL